MHQSAQVLTTLGLLFLVGLITDLLGRRTRLPRVTLLVVFGFLIGPFALDLTGTRAEQWYPLVADMTLVMIGFLLGGTLGRHSLRRHGPPVFWISLSVAVVTAVVTSGGLLAAGVPLLVALLLGGVAPATDPAATSDVVHETGARGPFAKTLLGIVAIDDAWGLILFSLALTAADMLSGNVAGTSPLVRGTWEIGGALALGIGIGIPMAYLTGRVRRGEPTQAEALGLVLLCGGAAMWLEVSFLLASMALGATVVNLARHHNRPFHAIEGIEWPFMILFFVLAGATVQPGALGSVWLLGAGYVLLRVLGRLSGAWLGALAAGCEPAFRRWMGVALMPQAGVAVGMALVASQRYPALQDFILPVVLGATVLFETVGPLLTRRALDRAGALPASPAASGARSARE